MHSQKQNSLSIYLSRYVMLATNLIRRPGGTSVLSLTRPQT